MDKHQAPWNLTREDKGYQEEPWILKKGKDSVTIQKLYYKAIRRY